MNNQKILSISDYIITAILALAFTTSPYYINNNGECLINSSIIISAIIMFIVLTLINYYVRKFITGYYNRDLNDKSYKFLIIFDDIMSNKYHFLIIAGIMLIFWLPVIIALYPGTFINDTWGQLQQYIVFTDNGSIHKGVLFDHHPIFSTIYMGSIIVSMEKITGNWHAAMFIYVLLQTIFTSLAFSGVIHYVYHKLKVGSAVTLATLTIYCLMPFYPASIQTICKDSLSAWIFTIFVILFMEIVRTDGHAMSSKRFFAGLILSTLFSCLTKKVEVYVIILTLFIAVLFIKKNRLKLIITIVINVICMFIIMPFILDRLEAIPGGKQEMFSIPFQQSARYARYYSNDYTESESNAINKLLDMSDLADRYDPISADPVKGFWERGTSDDYKEYLKAWLSQGLRHPGTYIAAFNAMEAGWFSWVKYDPVMNMGWHSQQDINLIPEWVPERQGLSKKTADRYQEFYNNLYDNSFLRIILSYGMYAAIIPAFTIATVFRKWKKRDIKYYLALLPLVLSIILGCWLGPLSIHFEGRRYLYPVTYQTPLVIAWCLFIYKDNVNKENI